MPIKAVIFDIDGTLVDSNEQHVVAWIEAFRRFGHEFDRAVVHAQVGKGADMLVPTLLHGADKARAEELGNLHGEIFKSKFLPQVRPFRSARDLLIRVFQAGQQIALASSASRGEVEHYLGLLDAHALVTVTTSADDVENSKPAPDIFAAALHKLRPLSAAEAIVVGDTPYDVEAARACWMSTVALRSGKFPDQVLRSAGAIALYEDVAELLREYERSPLTADRPRG